MRPCKLHDLYNKHLNFRISDRQFNYLLLVSKKYNFSVAEYIRYLIDSDICRKGVNPVENEK